MSFDNPLDLTALESWKRPRERLKCEYHTGKMAAKDLSLWQKFITTVFLFAWMGWTGAMAFDTVSTTPSLMSVWSIASALGFYIIGNMHGIKRDELRQLASTGISISLNNSDGSEGNSDTSDTEE